MPVQVYQAAWLTAEGISPWVYVAFAVVLLAVLVLPRRLAKRSKILDDPKRAGSAQEELRHSMDRLLVELQETAREINATIDTKMIALNRLIEEADRRIDRLDKLHRQTPPAAAAPTAVDGAPSAPLPPRTSAPSAPPVQEDPVRGKIEQEIYRLADEGKTELEIARLTGTPRGEVELVLGLRREVDHETPDDDRETP